MDDSFKKVPLQVPKLSGFDKSHQNLLTSKVGTITPILVDELIPGSRVNLKLALSAQLPPLASDTFMRCSVKCEAFFVPMRLLAGSFESWFTDDPRLSLVDQDGGEWIGTEGKGFLPVICDERPIAEGPDTWAGGFNAVGSLADYLGFKSTNPNFLKHGISAMPFLAYHKIYDDWYRNTLVQRPVFVHPATNWGLSPAYAASAPYVFFGESDYVFYSPESMLLADNVYLWSLRQRNFGLDYFTTATPEPQQGDASRVSFEIPASGPGSFSIAALRAANSYQQFKERNNIAGNYYPDQIEARYNVRLSDGVAQRSLYLGRAEFEVYSKGIYQTAQDIQQGTSDASQSASGSGNPFASVGSRYGAAYAAGEHFIVNFEAKEPGYLFVMATLVPRVTYSSGVRRMLLHYRGAGSLVDMANPILQAVGPQPIHQYELNGEFPGLPGSSPSIFGYTDRYAEFKTMEDELHGLLRDGQSLEAFALQRGFSYSDNVEISSEFLQIPTDYLDQVAAVSGDLSKFGYWCDCFFNYRLAMPISKYSLPTLQDPAYEHGATVVVNRGGTKL